jgi:Amt family ammonium transporter
MQVGFMLVETGFVRERSMSGIAIKTFLMLLASSLSYSVVGYSMMYGSDVFGGLIGWGPSAHDLGMEWQFYQTGFAAVSATIISGAIAERTTLTINVLIAFVIGGFVYPVVGHWAWASDGCLHQAGFHDLAGSGVVHFLGGMSSAAAAWIAGPRLDKYDPINKKINDYVGERSLPLVSCGVIFLWLGWMGFNGGSVRDADEFQHAGFYIIATCCAASAGGFSIMLLSPLSDIVVKWIRMGNLGLDDLLSLGREFVGGGGLARPFDVLAATMGGMVAITANSDLLLNHSYLLALPVGMCGGAAVFATSKLLRSEYVFRRVKIDDPAEAIAVHAGAGAAGILIAAFFTSHGVPVRLYMQVVGLLAIGGFSFLVVAAVFFVLNGRSRDEAPATRTKFYAETFGPDVWEEKVPIEEVLGKVHYLFASNFVRSTKNEENVGLRFEPKSARAAAFPLRTAIVANELQQDVKNFLEALVSAPIHNWDSTINQLLAPEDFRNHEKYQEVRNALLLEVEEMKSMSKLEVSPEAVPIVEVVRKVYEEFAASQPLFRSKVVDGHVDRPDEFMVFAQKSLLENVVRALFSNAARAVISRDVRGEEGYTPMVRYELQRDAHRVVLSVIDNGDGVPPRVQERLFEPFNRDKSGGGHGLGLYYAATVVEGWGGRLVLSRNDGNETIFEMILLRFKEGEKGEEEAEDESSHVGRE